MYYGMLFHDEKKKLLRYFGRHWIFLNINGRSNVIESKTFVDFRIFLSKLCDTVPPPTVLRQSSIQVFVFIIAWYVDLLHIFDMRKQAIGQKNSRPFLKLLNYKNYKRTVKHDTPSTSYEFKTKIRVARSQKLLQLLILFCSRYGWNYERSSVRVLLRYEQWI